jgi:hypothetical protein
MTGGEAMNVDDRDCFEDTVTSEHRLFAEVESEPPPFLAMGTAVEGLDDLSDTILTRPEDHEVTQPIPRMTMAELVFEPTRAPIGTPVRSEHAASALGTPVRSEHEPVQTRFEPVARAIGAPVRSELAARVLGTQVRSELVFEPVQPVARALGTIPPSRAESVVEVKARGTLPPPTGGLLGAVDLARFVDGVDRVDLLLAVATAKHADVDPHADTQVEAPTAVDLEVEAPIDLLLAAVAEVELPATSRKIRPRRTRPRARTIAPRRLTSVELRQVASTASAQAERPKTRAECAHEQRPCPWVSCKHHLYLDVNPRTGTIKLNFPDLEPWELEHTCALDVADDGGHTLEEVGDITNLTRERIRQLELRGLLELRGRSRNLR